MSVLGQTFEDFCEDLEEDFLTDLKQLVGKHFEDNFEVGSWRYFEEALKVSKSKQALKYLLELILKIPWSNSWSLVK